MTRWREPGGPGVRIDSGIEQGWRVPGEYDPLLAKVLVVAPDRELALARARRAVDEFETGGVQTTLPFHAWLLPASRVQSRAACGPTWWRGIGDPRPLREAAAERAADVMSRHVWLAAGRPASGSGSAEPGEPPCARSRTRLEVGAVVMTGGGAR